MHCYHNIYMYISDYLRMEIFLCKKNLIENCEKNYKQTCREQKIANVSSVNECHKIDTTSWVRKTEHMRSRQNVPGQSRQDGIQTVKSHGIQNSYYFMYSTQIVRFSFVECKNLLPHHAVVKIYITRVCQNYVWLSGTGRNFVGICKPLTWLVCGTSTFLIRKNTETVEKWLTVELKLILC